MARARHLELDGSWAAAERVLEAVLRAAPAGPREAEVLLALVRLSNAQDFIQAPVRAHRKAALLERVRAIAAESDDPLLLAAALHEQAVDLHVGFFHDAGDVDLEERLLTQARALRRTHGDEAGAAWSLFYLGTVRQVMRRDLDGAARLLAEADEAAQGLRDPILSSYVVRHLGQLLHEHGELRAARVRYEHSLQLRLEAGWYAGTLAAHLSVGAVCAELGDLGTARSHFERARDVGRAIGAGFMLRAAVEELGRLPPGGIA